jgi:hypothetical protein
MAVTGQDLGRILDDPREFIERLQIVTDMNEKRFMYPWFEEQEWLFTSLTTRRNTLCLKCRQVGFSTLTKGFTFWKVYTSPRPRQCLEVVHDDDAQTTFRKMTRRFWEGLPPGLRFPMKPNNLYESGFPHNDAKFHRIVAGGGGQARGDTYTDLHFTEMAKYPRGSAAHANADTDTDADMWQSANATVHVPDASVIVESTGNGPLGKFHDLWKIAKADAVRPNPTWGYVFVPWTQCERYQRPVPDPKALQADLNSEERRLMGLGLSLEQIAWRRWKLAQEGATPLRFRREYPLTDLEPFMVDAHGWFDQEALNELLALIPSATPERRAILEQPVKVLVPPEPGRRYGMGLDTSGGVGRDDAAIKVWRDDLIECCVWHSSRASPREQGEMAMRIGGLFGGRERVTCLIEANKYGKAVINAVEEAGSPGVTLWKDDKGGDFWSTGGRAGDTKRELFVYGRELVRNQHVVYNYEESIHQAQQIVELPNGEIRGAGDAHDDLVMADLFAWWALKPYTRRPGTAEDERIRHRARMARRRNPLGNKGTR